MKDDNTRLHVIDAIRDARDLDADEKAFLWTVESRGVMFASAPVAAGDMGMSRAQFYRVAARLHDRGLVTRTGRERRHRWRVNEGAVIALIPA